MFIKWDKIILFGLIVFFVQLQVCDFGQANEVPSYNCESQPLTQKNDKEYRDVLVEFKGGQSNDNALQLYQFLLENKALPCRLHEIPGDNIYISDLVIENNYLPVDQYPKSANKIICQLNPDKCACPKDKSRCTTEQKEILEYYEGDSFLLPSIEFRPSFYVEEISLLPEERTPADLEKILRRINLINDKTSPEKIRKILFTTNLRNFFFKFPFYKKNESGTKKTNTETKVISVSKEGTRARITVPYDKFISSSVIEKLRNTGNFHQTPVSSLAPNIKSNPVFIVKSNYSAMDEILKTNKAVTKMAHFIKKKSFTNIPRILIYDIGIDKGIIKARIGKNATKCNEHCSSSPNIIYEEFTDEEKKKQNNEENQNSCKPQEKHHGSHLWGIIGANSSDNSLLGLASPACTCVWDYDEMNKINDQKDYYQIGELFSSSEDFFNIYNFSFYQDPFPDDDPSKFDALVLGNTLDTNDALGKKIKDADKSLFVIAAGNYEKLKTSLARAALPNLTHKLKNVIVVGALSEEGDSLYSKSYRNGPDVEGDVVHIAAPGEKIFSLCKEKRMGPLSGTSQAAAFVTSAAATLLSENIMPPQDIKARLIYTADILPNIWDKVYGGRLNLFRALDVKKDKFCEFQENSKNGTNCDDGAWHRGAVTFKAPLRTANEGEEEKLHKLEKIKFVSKGKWIRDLPVKKILRIHRISNRNFYVFWEEGNDKNSIKRLEKVKEFLPAQGKFKDEISISAGNFTIQLNSVGDFVRRTDSATPSR